MAVGIIATLKVQDGKQAEFEAAFSELASAVRANEPGNFLYSLTLKRGTTNEYVVMEQYADDAAVEAHGKSAHFLAAGPKLGACLAGRPELVHLDVKVQPAK
jgi:quinol monooxygenase YgiN